MLALAFWIACAAVAMGTVLAAVYIRGPQAPWAVALVHGMLGAASLGLLLTALTAGLPRSGMGTASFGPIAAGLFALALALGLALGIGAWRRRRPPGVLVGAHAGLAIAGFVVLLALFALEPAASVLSR